MEDWMYSHSWGQLQFKGQFALTDYFEDLEWTKPFDV
jgi:hypothetical protein